MKINHFFLQYVGIISAACSSQGITRSVSRSRRMTQSVKTLDNHGCTSTTRGSTTRTSNRFFKWDRRAAYCLLSSHALIAFIESTRTVDCWGLHAATSKNMKSMHHAAYALQLQQNTKHVDFEPPHQYVQHHLVGSLFCQLPIAPQVSSALWSHP